MERLYIESTYVISKNTRTHIVCMHISHEVSDIISLLYGVGSYLLHRNVS